MRLLLSGLQVLRQSVDADYCPGGVEQTRARPDNFDAARALSFILLHLGCLAVLWVGWSWTAALAAVLLYLLRMFAVTAFYHRYFAHRTFRTSRLGQFAFAAWANCSMQRGPLWWAAVHRHHHQHSDEEEDVHSPTIHGLWWSHIGWMTSSRNFPTDYDRVRDLASFPELRLLNRFDLAVPLAYGLALFGAGHLLAAWFPSLHTTGAQLFVWGFFVSTVVLLHATLCINSMAHMVGGRRFATTDSSRNSLLLAVLTLGEGWHNNHHRYMSSVRQGFFWWEFDPTYYGLKAMSWLGLIWDLRPVPASVYQEAARAAPPLVVQFAGVEAASPPLQPMRQRRDAASTKANCTTAAPP